MTSIQKRTAVASVVGLFLVLAGNATIVSAGPLTHTFVSGDKLTAAQMNDINTAVNDNDTRVTKLENGNGTCPTGMVNVGPICMDIYEASIVDTGLTCSPNGNDCQWVAQSVAGVAPQTSVTWFQAQQACANAHKRLPTNAEWQMAAAGTPDDVTCVTGSLANTGANAGCVSRWGVHDMVGNVSEWVADWMQGGVNVVNSITDSAGDTSSVSVMTVDSTNATATYGTDAIGGVSKATPGGVNPDNSFPAAVYRGGDFGDSTNAGVFYFQALRQPSGAATTIGFRCVR
jgi:hypothetical protein